jgi:hypothetical protein
MADWVTETNIREFRAKIERETDPEKRRILKELLAKEEGKRGQEDIGRPA